MPCRVYCTHYYERQSDRVTFYLKVPEARGVAFASSLDAYSPHLASKVDGSRWVVSVAAGSEFRYFYIVDGGGVRARVPILRKG